MELWSQTVGRSSFPPKKKTEGVPEAGRQAPALPCRGLGTYTVDDANPALPAIPIIKEYSISPIV